MQHPSSGCSLGMNGGADRRLLPACSEATCTDPQTRMLLENIMEFLPSHQSSSAMGTSVGVYLGCMYTGERCLTLAGASIQLQFPKRYALAAMQST